MGINRLGERDLHFERRTREDVGWDGHRIALLSGIGSAPALERSLDKKEFEQKRRCCGNENERNVVALFGRTKRLGKRRHVPDVLL